MSRGKKKPKMPLDDMPAQEEWTELGVDESVAPSAELNELMSTYRETTLPTPVLMWRTEGKTVAAWELSDTEWERVVALLGIDQ